ncbi:MAG TPA: hypothetical protein VIH37_11835 [Candidatus Limnocylindrales bacterium]
MIVDQLNQMWTNLLEFTSRFVVPDWGALVGLIPILLLIGVVGPIVTILALAWLRYGVLRPRRRTSFADVRRPAELDADGKPVFPAGEPYSLAEGMIYEPGATRSASGDELRLACPKCGLVRSAVRDTCGNCGLSFAIKPVTRSSGAASRPTGGAAAA